MDNCNIDAFVQKEKAFLASLPANINWNDDKWHCADWLFHRGSTQHLLFRELSSARKAPPLPYPYIDFCKAVIVHIQRTKNVNFIALNKYLIECKRIYNVMRERKETDAASLTRWHFERSAEVLKESGYKMIYDACVSLRVISEVIDRNCITAKRIEYNPDIKPTSSRHSYTPLSKLDSDETRKDDEKLPSYEAMAAYAQSTNNPVNKDEEILLRTIDLLTAMGQRANEVALLPLNCWVERERRAKDGSINLDSMGNSVKDFGIRYFAEKGSEDKVHWLATQDIQFTKRAVDRLIVLTAEVREIAKWQENNPGKLWKHPSDQIMSDDEILESISFANHYNLHLFLNRNGVRPVKSGIDRDRVNLRGNPRYKKRNFYKAGDVEELLLKKFFDGHDQLKKEKGDGLETILRTSMVLPIAAFGAFQFKERSSFKVKVIVRRVTLRDINTALGAVEKNQSIFDRRNLTEANGDRIVLTSHQPRHWRNTLYELAGMSNVQQALAMGRQRLDQNPTYQHTSLLERTQTHRDYLTFRTPREKIQFLHDGIREKRILGEITNLYHELKSNKGVDIAETFLNTHATAIHVTPFGGCTHDFSQAPCPKHLQCWNGCSHLHRTNTPGESERIKEQIELSQVVLKSMKADSEGEYGADVWTQDLEKKIENMRKALDIKPLDKPVKVFPDGKPVTVAFENRKGSSVSDE